MTMPLLSTQFLCTCIYILRNRMEARHWTKGGTSAGGKGGRKGEQAQEGRGMKGGKFWRRGKTRGNVHALLKEQRDGK
jgi:hypothetical protein